MKKTADFDQKPTLIFIHGMRGNHHGLVDLARYMRNEYMPLFPPEKAVFSSCWKDKNY